MRLKHRDPLPSNFEQDGFHSVITLPLGETRQLDRVDLTKSVKYFLADSSTVKAYLSVPLVDTWKIDPRDKLNRGRVIGVIGTAVDVDAVYPVLMDALSFKSAAAHGNWRT